MKKIIYHGSTKIIKKPELKAGNAFNDFGLGFYCTESQKRAAEWAVGRNRNGFVSSYSIDCTGLRIIDLCSPQYTLLHWISLLFNYREFDSDSRIMHDAREYIVREFAEDYQGADCIIGFRADDCCYALTRDFLRGTVSYQSLREALTDENIGRQFVLKSNRAFDRILYTGYAAAHHSSAYPRKNRVELNCLKRAYNKSMSDGLYIQQMIDEEIKAYDSRLR